MIGVAADLREVKVDIRSVKTDVGVLKTDVGVLKTDVRELKAEVGGVTRTVVALAVDVADLKKTATADRTHNGRMFEHLLKVQDETLTLLKQLHASNSALASSG